MEQVEVEILTQTITAQYGTLEVGATLRTSAAFAKHLVDDCMAAKYSKQRSAGPEPRADAVVLIVPAVVQTSAQQGSDPGLGLVTIAAPASSAPLVPAAAKSGKGQAKAGRKGAVAGAKAG